MAEGHWTAPYESRHAAWESQRQRESSGDGRAGADAATETDPAVLRAKGDALAKAAKDAEVAAKAEPSEGNRHLALVAHADAVRAKAKAAFAAVLTAADVAIAEAVRAAGDDPVDRAKAKAAAVTARAESLGHAEVAYEAAELAYDQAVVETAKVAKLIAHRIESAKARVAKAEAAAANDPMAIGNPYYKAPPTLAQWQFDSLPSDVKLKAIKDGVIIDGDEAPPFTADEARSVLRSRGSKRTVLTRDEFRALPMDRRAKAARDSIIIDD